MELDFRHPELFANPIHLLAIHIEKKYRKIDEASTADTFRLHDKVFSRYCLDVRSNPLTARNATPRGLLSHDAIDD